MDNGNEMRDFLVSRRARITPQQAANSAEPGTPSDDALKLLDSWAATLDEAGHGSERAV